MNRMEQISSGLEFLHGIRIAHRDLKNDNIGLKEGITRILDFGVSSVIGGLRSDEVGTLNHQAPEISQKKEHSPEKADIFALGILYFEILTSKMPFVASLFDGNYDEVDWTKNPSILIPLFKMTWNLDFLGRPEASVIKTILKYINEVQHQSENAEKVVPAPQEAFEPHISQRNSTIPPVYTATDMQIQQSLNSAISIPQLDVEKIPTTVKEVRRTSQSSSKTCKNPTTDATQSASNTSVQSLQQPVNPNIIPLRRSNRQRRPVIARQAKQPVIRKVTSVRSGDFNAVVEYLKKENVQVRRNKLPNLTASQKSHAYNLIRSNVKDGKKIKDGDMDGYLQRAINSSLVTKFYGKAGTKKTATIVSKQSHPDRTFICSSLQ